jgi:hypothetical protein
MPMRRRVERELNRVMAGCVQVIVAAITRCEASLLNLILVAFYTRYGNRCESSLHSREAL